MNDRGRLASALKAGQIQPVELKAHTFGRKCFFRSDYQGREAWVKLYQGIDLPMRLTADTDFRELQFVGSSAAAQMQAIFRLPYLDALRDPQCVVMEDMSTELARFGPPSLPTAEQMEMLIRALGQKDAMSVDPSPWLGHPDTSLNVLGEIIADLINGRSTPLVQQLRDEWPWFEQGLHHLQRDNPSLYERVVSVSQDGSLGSELLALRSGLQHGDFYFNNIGFTDQGIPVVIDWEAVMIGPLGMDLATLIDGMPPLPFMAKALDWYLESFNAHADQSLPRATLEHHLALLQRRALRTSGLIDLIYFGYSGAKTLPTQVREGMIADFVAALAGYHGQQSPIGEAAAGTKGMPSAEVVE